MKTGKKLLTGTVLAICAALLVLCSVLAIGWSKAAKTGDALPEVRNNGTAIQWKYSDEADWHNLVALTELRGTAGENGADGKNGKDGKDGSNGADGKNGINGTNGKDGINGSNGKDGINGVDGKDGADGKNGKDGIDGANGKDGINAKSIEVQRAETHIQWRYEGDEWQNLVAIADITGPTGQKGADGANGKTSEFRVSENTLQWRYVGDEIWLNLYDLSVLKGLDGKDGINGKDGADGKDGTNGQNGSDGVDGNTPFIGENGNWWIGETDTSVKAAGIDGTDGEKGDKGDKGDKGEKGDKGDKGDAGQNGSCSGYFHASNGGTGASFNQPLQLFEDCNSGGLFVWDRANRTVTLKAGHTYSISFSGSVCISHDMGGWYSVVLKGRQGILNDTLIERYMNDADNSRVWMPFAFNRIYNAGSDIVLQYEFIQLTPGTQLNGAVYNITIIALD